MFYDRHNKQLFDYDLPFEVQEAVKSRGEAQLHRR